MGIIFKKTGSLGEVPNTFLATPLNIQPYINGHILSFIM